MMNAERRMQNEIKDAELNSAFSIHHSAFTLTELLVVIGIIVLMLALAVPALKILGGGADINSAENQMAAILGRARAQAIADQTVAGVMFFMDPADGRIKGAIVEESPSAVTVPTGAVAGTISLDLATDSLATDNGFGGNPVADFFAMPGGVGVQFIDNYQATAVGVEQDDRYIGFNAVNNYNGGGTPPPAPAAGAVVATPYGGTILFDGTGKLVAVPYVFHTAFNDTAGVAYTKLGQLLFGTTQYDKTLKTNEEFVSPTPINVARDSQFGLIVFNHDAFAAKGFTDADAEVADPLALPGSYTTAGDVAAGAPAESVEEQWLDDNSTPLIINRYDGSLIRGE